MSELIQQLMHLLLVVLGAMAVPDAATLGISVAIVALTLLAIAIRTLVLTAPAGSSPPHPLRAIAASTLLTQSDPDAPGHPRPRAPGVAHAA